MEGSAEKVNLSMSSSSTRNTLSSKEKKEKEKKDKKEKDKSEKFDPNIEREDNASSGESEMAVQNGAAGNNGASAGRHDSSTSDMQKFCQILQAGFDSVTKKIGEKLDDVGQKFGNSLNDLHESLDDRMTELADKEQFLGHGNNDDPEGDMDMDIGSITNSQNQRQGDHDMSDTSSTNAENVSKSYFKDKNKPKSTEKVGEKVDQDLADIVNREFSSPMSTEEYKAFKEKFIRPENVDWLTSPEVPFNIYRRLHSDFKDVDKRLKFIQDQLCPVAISLTYAMDKLGSGDFVGGMDTLSETVKGFGFVFHNDITERRRSLLKTKLPDDFKVLASDKCPPTPTNLLGNISENSKKISETEKIATQMDKAANARAQSSKRNNNKDKPYSKNNSGNQNNGKNSYFKKGGSYNNKRYNNQNQKKSYDNKEGQGSSKNFYHGDSGGNSYFQKRNQRRN